jgi:alkylation response protein AidB-like acyl-CoA dehydrogenase
MSFLTYPATEDQKKWSAIIGDLAHTFTQRASIDEWEGQFHKENFSDLHRAGYLTLTVPRELGGHGASLLDAVLAQYRLAQGDGSTALVAGMHLTYIARLAEGRTEFSTLFKQICHEVVEHGAMINAAISEPTTGSPSRQPDGSWIINGRKNFTTGSHALHFFLVGCSVEDEHGDPLGNGQRQDFLVTCDIPGVRIEDTWHMLGMRGTASNDLVLDQVHVGADACVEESIPLPSLPAIQDRVESWKLLTTAVYLGIAQAARDEALRFARQRQPNSLKQSIAHLPHIQEKAGKMDIALLESRAMLFGVAEQLSTDPTSVPPSTIAATKYIVTNHAIEIVDIAMRLVGAASLALTSPLQRHYRDVRAGLHNPPMDDATLALLGKQALEVRE